MNWLRFALASLFLSGSCAFAAGENYEGRVINGRLVAITGDWADDTHVTQYVVRDAEIDGQKLGDVLFFNPMLKFMTTPNDAIDEALRTRKIGGKPLVFARITLAGKTIALSELVKNVANPDAPAQVRLGSIELRALNPIDLTGSTHKCCMTFN